MSNAQEVTKKRKKTVYREVDADEAAPNKRFKPATLTDPSPDLYANEVLDGGLLSTSTTKPTPAKNKKPQKKKKKQKKLEFRE